VQEALDWAAASEATTTGTRGLLLGIMRAGREPNEADQLLRHFGVTLDRLLEALAQSGPAGEFDPNVTKPSRRAKALTPNAAKAVRAAGHLSREDPASDGHVHLRHLLGGVLETPEGSGYRALAQVLSGRAELREVADAYREFLASGDPRGLGDVLRRRFPRGGEAGSVDNVPSHSDRPAGVDRLGRDILAEVLAVRLRKIREPWKPVRLRDSIRHTLKQMQRALRREPPAEPPGPRGSFILHLDGRWGSGKSSLLNFVERELAYPHDPGVTRWVVVRFNAWEHQRIAPPWWWLMTAIHKQATQGLWRINRPAALKLVLRNFLWRLRDGWAAYLFLPLAALIVWLVVKTGFFGLQKNANENDGLNVLLSALKSLTAIGAFAISIWGAVQGINRWLLVGSAQGAATLLPRTRDPMKVLRRRHAQLVRAIRHPIVVFVDDLDRCKAEYVVELLEGVQTLFADEPVTYVIAADRHWVGESFAQVYSPYVVTATEPGRPLGYLFLEKTFQLVVPVPRLVEETRNAYWHGLIRESADGLDVTAEQAEAKEQTAQTVDQDVAAERDFAALGTQEAVLAELHREPGKTPKEAHARLRAALLRLEHAVVEEETRHTLQHFAPLLEDNPRAMKRLVNAYGVERHIAVMRAVRDGKALGEDDFRRLALWTILKLRWPLLWEYVEEHPDVLPYIRGPAPDDVPLDIRRLLANDAVVAVVTGKGLEGVSLLEDAATPGPPVA
jgi:hypothetical protein